MTMSQVKGKKVILTGQKQDRDTADGTIEILLLFYPLYRPPPQRRTRFSSLRQDEEAMCLLGNGRSS